MLSGAGTESTVKLSFGMLPHNVVAGLWTFFFSFCFCWIVTADKVT